MKKMESERINLKVLTQNSVTETSFLQEEEILTLHVLLGDFGENALIIQKLIG